ncbi:methylated-DNA--[protein]-cysteine S-methyltransferase [Ideonella sp. A 288]|uniref:methylated-DNA--[protein]-cysteine S-methyltransferase n=1 Tax=Ideonella sp. A 288 TaxID=1962181 RepID=UPI000B4AB706|nr:methylated-DNA--[protein]-cysteine S-methyltransferase [Ideonella sp. A 288]
MAGWCCFDTALGPCGIAWGDEGIVGSQLPQATPEATRDRMSRRFPALSEADPPAEVAAAIAGVQAQLRGERCDLSAVRLDLRGVSAFHQRVYALSRELQPGQTTTYGELAERLADAGLARAVGQALGLNPFAPIVPCHRVLAAGGRSGGFSAEGGAQTKLRMLALEGAAPNGQPSLF